MNVTYIYMSCYYRQTDERNIRELVKWWQLDFSMYRLFFRVFKSRHDIDSLCFFSQRCFNKRGARARFCTSIEYSRNVLRTTNIRHFSLWCLCVCYFLSTIFYVCVISSIYIRNAQKLTRKRKKKMIRHKERIICTNILYSVILLYALLCVPDSIPLCKHSIRVVVVWSLCQSCPPSSYSSVSFNFPLQNYMLKFIMFTA